MPALRTARFDSTSVLDVDLVGIFLLARRGQPHLGRADKGSATKMLCLAKWFFITKSPEQPQLESGPIQKKGRALSRSSLIRLSLSDSVSL